MFIETVKLTDEQIRSVVQCVRLGHQSAFETLFKSVFPLVKAISMDRARRFGVDGRDMESAGVEGALVAIDLISKGKPEGHENYVGFILLYVKNYLTKQLRFRYAVTMPRGEGQSTIFESLVNWSEQYDEALQAGGANDVDAFIKTALKPYLDLCESETQRQYILYKVAGLNDREISSLIGLNPGSMTLFRKTLKWHLKARGIK
jgi:hypothetical protein